MPNLILLVTNSNNCLDFYSLYDQNNNKIFINETDIANSYDKLYNFKRYKDYDTLQWMDVTNGIFLFKIEHFIVWMQMESFPNFRKLWGRIEQTLTPGTYNVSVNNCNCEIIFFRL